MSDEQKFNLTPTSQWPESKKTDNDKPSKPVSDPKSPAPDSKLAKAMADFDEESDFEDAVLTSLTDVEELSSEQSHNYLEKLAALKDFDEEIDQEDDLTMFEADHSIAKFTTEFEGTQYAVEAQVEKKYFDFDKYALRLIGIPGKSRIAKLQIREKGEKGKIVFFDDVLITDLSEGQETTLFGKSGNA